jgi:hypothetical protein
MTEESGFDSRQSKRFFSIASRRLWSLLYLLPYGDRELYSWGLSDRGVKLTAHLHSVPRSRVMELYLHFPICLHGIVLNHIIKFFFFFFGYTVLLNLTVFLHRYSCPFSSIYSLLSPLPYSHIS